MDRRHFARVSLAASTIVCADEHLGWSAKRRSKRGRDYDFKKIISRDVLDHYLSRSITMEVLLSGRGDLNDNIRMLRSTGAKYIGRSICLWGREGELLDRLGAARHQVPLVHTADPDMILVACIFEIVGTQVEQVPCRIGLSPRLECRWSRKAFGTRTSPTPRARARTSGARADRCQT